MDEYSEDIDVSVDVEVENDIEVDIDTEVSDDIDMEIEDDIIEDDIEIEDDIIEDDIEIEDDIIEDEVEIEDDVIEDEVEIEDDVIEDDIEIEDDAIEDEVEVEEDVVEDEVEEPLEETTEEVEEVVDEVEEPLEETTEEVEEVEDEVEEPLEETMEEVEDEVEEPLEETTEETMETTEETEEVEDEVEEPLEETTEETMEATEETEEVVDEAEEPLEETMEEVEEVEDEVEEPLEETTEETMEATEETEEAVDEAEELLEETTEETIEATEENEEVVDGVEEPMEEVVDEGAQDSISEDGSDDTLSEGAADDTSDDSPEADIHQLEEPLETETVEVDEPTENITPPEQHTFDDWLNPENYDADGHYIGQGQDFGYKPEGMDTAEYAEQIDQEARDAYADHIKQQDMSWEEQAQAYGDYVEAQENYGKTPDDMVMENDISEEEIPGDTFLEEDIPEDYIPDDVVDDLMNDAEDIAIDNNEIIQDIEDDVIPEDILPSDVVMEDIDTSAVDAEVVDTNSVDTNIVGEVPPVREMPPPPPPIKDDVELEPEKPVDKKPVMENGDAITSDMAKQPERSALDAMTAYMYEHNYGKDDYPEYSQDPEWQQLNQALQEEMGIPVDIPAYDTDNISGGNTEPMSQDPGGNTEPANVQPSQDSALEAMTAYMYEHNYGKGDYPEYSQDPEWQRLNQALQEEMGIPVDTPVNDVSPEIVDVKEQAAKDLMENYDVGKADFHDFDPDVASAVSDAVRDAKKDFPDLEVQYIGSIDSQVGGIREEYIDYYTKELEKIPNSGWTKDEMRTIAEYNADKTISNWGLDDTDGTFAWSLNIPKDVDPTGGKLEQYNGVAINNTYASDYEGFKEAKEEEVRIKHKPIGCNTPRATIDHELGHEIDNLLDASHDKKLIDLYDSMMSKGNAENELSGYSQTNIKEFIAEGYSEYRNNPNPREYATKIYERLKELNQNRGRKSFWKRK